MAAPIQRLTRLASKTFSRFNAAEGFQNDRLAQLRSSFNEITAADVNFDPEALKERDRLNHNRAPVTYIHLWEDESFSMGIFVVKRGGRLPLHDHPGMFGLLKVIHGTLKLVSFSEAGETKVPDEMSSRLQKWQVPLVKSVKLETEANVSAEQGCCQLTPTTGNFHEITPVTEMTAFVDILAPPYDQAGRRDCHYYRELPMPSAGSGSMNSRWIIRVPQPLDFWCDSIDYSGPTLDLSDT